MSEGLWRFWADFNGIESHGNPPKYLVWALKGNVVTNVGDTVIVDGEDELWCFGMVHTIDREKGLVCIRLVEGTWCT